MVHLGDICRVHDMNNRQKAHKRLLRYWHAKRKRLNRNSPRAVFYYRTVARNKNGLVIVYTWVFILLVAMLTTAAGDPAIAKDYPAYREACSVIRDDVENWLTAEGITPDYFYLLVAESHCQGDRVSKAGAVGYWQMMPATARKYGCDSPLDLECQTHAAARYLRHLEKKCGIENVVYCWHDGGSNFLRRGEPTKGAKGLAWQVRRLMRTDNPQ